MENKQHVTYFAQADYRGAHKQFGIKADDRTKHVYIIGKTGMGKSTLLENMAAQDIIAGNGIAFIDPHGSAVETLLDYVPKERVKDVVYFAPFDIEYPIAFNVMEDVGYDKRHLVVSNLVSAFKKIWVDAWSARMEYILSNVLFALLEYPDSTLIDVNRMLVDKEFRKKVIEHLTDPIVKSFWVDEFAKYTDKYTAEATPAIQNKVGQFISNPLIRNIIGQPKSSFDIRELMDNKKILLMNLSKGRMGEVNSKLIGSMLIIKIYLGAMSRADLSKSEIAKLPNFYFFVDEFQSFANETFADILSESRKYKLNLTIAHQYIEQMPEEVRDAVFGNVGTLMTFRVGAQDAEVLEKEFAPSFMGEDLVNLGFTQIYLKLMIDGLTSKPFSARTLPPLQKPETSFAHEVIANSRSLYSAPRAKVEEMIRARQAPVPPAAKPEGESGERGRENRGRGEYKREAPRHFEDRSPRYEERRGERDRFRDEWPTEARRGERFEEREARPFKKVLEQIPVERRIQSQEEKREKDGISLNLLRHNAPPERHIQSKDQVTSLKEALGKVISEQKTRYAPLAMPQERPKQHITKPVSGMGVIATGENQSHARSSVPPPQPKEIPEDELRKMLAIEEEK